MSGFTKLDSALTASSIWNEPDPVRIVWVTMLSLADKDGNVKGSVVGLAYLARKTLLETENALAILQAPDPHSGRKEQDGRRVVPFEGGWHLVNHAFYREAGMSEETKRYWREKKKAQRLSKNVPDSPPKSRSLGYASGDGDASASEEIYNAYPRKVGRPKAITEIEKALKKISAQDLLSKTKAFALAKKGADPQYIPHPATWFHQERFNDDPSTWKQGLNGAAASRAKKRSTECPEPAHDDSLVWRPPGVKPL